MTTRIIAGLQYAMVSAKPPHVGISRPRGAKAHGVRYEKQVAKSLPLARHGQWFQYVDAQGLGTCQTDLLLEFEGAMVVLEAKYTWTIMGHVQVERLYKPVVAKAFAKPAFGLVICKALRPEAEMGDCMVVHRLTEALRWCERKRTVLHWLGEAPFLALGPGTHFGPAVNPYTPTLVPTKRRA